MVEGRSGDGNKKDDNYKELLIKLVSIPESPYYNWRKVSSVPLRFRDYSESSNPKYQLSRFGLYDYAVGKNVKSLPEVIREVQKKTGIKLMDDFSSKPSKKSGKEKESGKRSGKKNGNAELSKSYERILQVCADDPKSIKNWEEKHWPFIRRYFEAQRKIPSSLVTPEFYRTQLNVIARQFTFESKKVYELVMPVVGLDGGCVQLHRIQIDPKTGEKLGKKFKGSASDSTTGEPVARGIFWPGNSLKSSHTHTMIFEGLEDALSVYAAMQTEKEGQEGEGKGKGKGQGAEWDFLVSLGTGYFRHINAWIQGSEGEGKEDGKEKWVLVLDNDTKEGEGKGGILETESVKASAVFEDRVERFYPPHPNEDANNVLQIANGEMDKVWEWLEKVQKNPLSWSQLRDFLDESEKAQEDEVIDNPFKYHFSQNPLSDTAVCDLFVSRFGSKVRYKAASEEWMVWNGGTRGKGGGMWEGRESGSEGRVRALIASLYYAYNREFKSRKETGEISTDSDAGKWQSFMKSLGNAARQGSVMRTLPACSAILCLDSDFDAEKDILNVKNGVLRLSTGELLKHSPEWMCSRQADVEWPVNGGEGAQGVCPTFDRFMSDITCGDRDLEAYKLRQLGYILSGHTKEKAFFFHLGAGDNGKSVEMDLMINLMGSYAKGVNHSLFTEQYGGGGDTDLYELAQLPGIRLAVCGETDERKSWSEAALKRFTGGTDTIQARAIRQAPFSFTPQFKLVIHGNNKPQMNVGDSAIWKRIHLIPYDFTAEEPDTTLDDKLRAEKSGILYRLVMHGYQAWLREGLKPPTRVLESKEEYRLEVFHDVDDFVQKECVIDGAAETLTADLYQEYKEFSRQNNDKPRSLTAFGRRLSELGFDIRKVHGNKVRVGIRVKSEDEKTAEFFNDAGDTGFSDEDDDLIH